MGIYDLPVETIEEILLHSDPLDVAAIALCSRFFSSVIYNAPDEHLWRALYLAQPFDDPTKCVSYLGSPRKEPFNWKSELQAIIRARTVLENVSLCKPHEACTILETLLNMVCWVPPLKYSNDQQNSSDNLLWVVAVTRGGVFLDEDKIGDREPSEEERQLRCQLHTLLGITPSDAKKETSLRARGFVYDFRNYNWGTEFGPFRPSSAVGSGLGLVNWVHMRHLHHLISLQLLELPDADTFGVIFYPLSLPFTQPVIPEGMNLDEEEDWVGVNDYNNESPHTGELNTDILASPLFTEIFRTMEVTLHVTKTVPDPTHPGRPQIYFVGVMTPPSSSTINGYVRLTDDGHIRWHFVSGEHGNAIWSSEGVQVGGVRSSFGVLGAWTTIFHHEDDPVGPFWMRKPFQDVVTTNPISR